MKFYEREFIFAGSILTVISLFLIYHIRFENFYGTVEPVTLKSVKDVVFIKSGYMHTKSPACSYELEYDAYGTKCINTMHINGTCDQYKDTNIRLEVVPSIFDTVSPCSPNLVLFTNVAISVILLLILICGLMMTFIPVGSSIVRQIQNGEASEPEQQQEEEEEDKKDV
jgi:hypothetical protein